MTEISIKKNNNQIDQIIINGHSGYKECGSDIVCSSISSIAITSINAILKMDEESLKWEQKDGYLNVKILKHTDVIDLLLENMIDLLGDLSKQYKNYVKII
jgi:hypothetical protein